MTYLVFPELDPVFETLWLLFVSNNLDAVQEETKKAISDLGFDGEQFYAQHFKLFEKYVEAFLKNRVQSPEDGFFFAEKDTYYSLMLLTLIIENKDWLTSTEGLTDDLINAQIFHICKEESDDDDTQIEIPSTLESIIQFLDSSDFEVNVKWKILRIMQHPTKYITALIHIINANLEAYDKAAKEIGKPLAKLLGQYEELLNNQGDKTFKELKMKLSQDSPIYPTLILPLSQLIFEKSCYYGLLCEKIIEDGRSRLKSKESLLVRLKALSDSSKLEIIASLKVSPKYNLEIARQLGLTAATMSHHMNALLNCGFVGIEKREGKVYYHLKKENLKGMIEDLEETLL